ncbi:MAG: hypothetical protein C4558_05770 [Dehalococcoidia bacterium]|nr:MAG: hypothetical protein C4558_05770 [Dehalococcoidia bacterium]
MKVIGKEIGDAIEPLFQEIEERLRAETENTLRVEAFEGGALSDVDWDESGVVVISLHNGIPTHALAHALGVALQHVRQTLDRYPDVVPGEAEVEGEGMLRHALRELILAPEAETRLAPLGLDSRWETEQRHQGMKDLLRQASKDWDEVLTPNHVFGALLYARFALDHPEELWAGLRKEFNRKFPALSESGEGVAQLVRASGWGSPEACVESLIAVRDELGMGEIALVEDRRDGTLL